MPSRPRSLRRAALLALALPALALPVLVATTPAAATTEVPGGSFSSPVALPTSIPGSFVASNAGVSSAAGGSTANQPYWNNTTWYSYTPSTTGVVSIRATSISPVNWDNTLEVWTAAGGYVAQRDDTYELDALVTPNLVAGTTYRIGLGGYHSGANGSATLTFGNQAPDAPTGLAVTAGDGSADLSWTAPDDHGSPISDYTVDCQRDGGAWTPCGGETGTPPATSTTVNGLVNGSAYRFRVTATNYIGTSVASAVAPSTASTGVVPGAVSTTTATAPSTAVRFTDVTVTAAVVSGGSPVAAGTVTVRDGGTVLGSGTVGSGAAVVHVQPRPGNRTLTVDFGGTAGVSASSTTVPITVTRAAQTVTLAAPSPASAGTAQTLTATSSAGLPVTLAASGPCTLTGTRVTADAPGSCTVTASSTGDADHAAATSVSRTFDVVAPLDLTLRVETPLDGLAAGATVVARGVGLQPGSAVTLELHSTPRTLATGVAAADGTVAIPTALPADIESGDHELVLLGVAPDGTSVRSVLQLSVSDSGRLVRIGDDAVATDRPALASTGSPVDVLGVAVVGLLVAGGALLLVGRRRSSTAG